MGAVCNIWRGGRYEDKDFPCYVEIDANMFEVKLFGHGYDVVFHKFNFPANYEHKLQPDNFPMWAECAVGFLDGLIKAAEDAKQAIQSERVQAFCRTNGR